MTKSDAGGNGEGWLKKGPWTAAEDAILMEYVRKHGEGHWNAVQRNTGLARCGKSCRLRWANHLRPNLKKGAFSAEEELLILRLHAQLGNKWARISSHLPGRTDNEIKNYWNTRIKRRQRAGLPLYPPDIQRELALKRQRLLYHDHPSSAATTTNHPLLLDHNNTTTTTTTTHFSTRPLDQYSSCFSTAMPTINRDTSSLPLLQRDHLPFFPSKNSIIMHHHPQHQLQQMEFNLALGSSYGLNSSPLPLPPVSPSNNINMELLLSAYPPASGVHPDTTLLHVDVQVGGDLQSNINNGLLPVPEPPVSSSDQQVRWSHLGGGEVDGMSNGATTAPRDGRGVVDSAAEWADSNWPIGTKMKKEPAADINDANAHVEEEEEEDVSQFLNMIQTHVNPPAPAPVSECYQLGDTGAISNEQSSVITEDGIWLETQQVVSSLSNQTKGQDWRTSRSYTWSNMPGIC